jgi:hypothetical protein
MRDAIIADLVASFKANGEDRYYGREVMKIRRKYSLNTKEFIRTIWGENHPGSNVNFRDFECGITNKSKFRKAIGKLSC